jgi:hypothetical protein
VSDYIGAILVPDPGASGAFPLVTQYPWSYTFAPEVIVHRIASSTANLKIEQRFYAGPHAKRFLVKCSMSETRRDALMDFWNDRNGPWQGFAYAAPNEDGSTTNYTVRFEDAPLSIEHLAAALSSAGVWLIEVPDPAAAPTYSISATQTRLTVHDDTLDTALRAQAQEIIPLVKILPREQIALTGTVDPAASTTLPGSGTAFLTELAIGDLITVNSESRTVTAVASDVSCDVDVAFTNTASATATKRDAIFLSDRRVTVGGILYLPRLIDWDGISQSIGGSSDLASFTFGNADRVMRDLANDTNLARSSVEFSLFHVGTTIKLDLWKGEITDWSCDEGPEFKVSASDGLYELNLPYPIRKADRKCWKVAGDQINCMATPASVCQKMFLSPDTGNDCTGLGQTLRFGGINVKPQGVRIRENASKQMVTATSVVDDSIYGKALPEIYTDRAMPVNCMIAAGREESDFYLGMGIVGRGPLGSYATPAYVATPDGGQRFAGHTIDGQPHHGFGTANPTYGLRTSLGPALCDSVIDRFSLAGEAPYTYASEVAWVEIRRSDTKGIQPTKITEHQMQALIATGLSGYAWTAPGTRIGPAAITNPVWVVVNSVLRALGLWDGATTAQQEAVFDCQAAISAAAICDDASVDRIIPNDGTHETQFQFVGVIGEQKPLRDWIQEILTNCCGYFVNSFGKLKIGLRQNSSPENRTFTTGNILLNSLSLRPIKPAFNWLSASFGNAEYDWKTDTVTLYDEEHGTLIGGTVPVYNQAQINLVGTCTKSQAARVVTARLREELGGITAAEWQSARQINFRTTVLALDVEAGMVCSLTHPDMPAGAGEFRVTGWRLNRDWSIDIEGRTTTDSMYDLTVGEKPSDIVADALPGELVTDTMPGDVVIISCVGWHDGVRQYVDIEYQPPGTTAATLGTFAGVNIHIEAPDGSGIVMFGGGFDYNGNADATNEYRYGTCRLDLPYEVGEERRVYLVSRSDIYTKRLTLYDAAHPTDYSTPNSLVTARAEQVIPAVTGFTIADWGIVATQESRLLVVGFTVPANLRNVSGWKLRATGTSIPSGLDLTDMQPLPQITAGMTFTNWSVPVRRDLLPAVAEDWTFKLISVNAATDSDNEAAAPTAVLSMVGGSAVPDLVPPELPVSVSGADTGVRAMFGNNETGTWLRATVVLPTGHRAQWLILWFSEDGGATWATLTSNWGVDTGTTFTYDHFQRVPATNQTDWKFKATTGSMQTTNDYSTAVVSAAFSCNTLADPAASLITDAAVGTVTTPVNVDGVATWGLSYISYTNPTAVACPEFFHSQLTIQKTDVSGNAAPDYEGVERPILENAFPGAVQSEPYSMATLPAATSAYRYFRLRVRVINRNGSNVIQTTAWTGAAYIVIEPTAPAGALQVQRADPLVLGPELSVGVPVAGGTAALRPANTNPSNLLPNGDFQLAHPTIASWPDKWTAYNNPTRETSPETGDYMMRLGYHASGICGIISEKIRVAQGERFALSLRVKHDATPGGALVAYFRFYTTAGTYISGSDISTNLGQPGTSWMTTGVSDTVPSGVGAYYLEVMIAGASVTNGKYYYVDRLVFTPVTVQAEDRGDTTTTAVTLGSHYNASAQLAGVALERSTGWRVEQRDDHVTIYAPSGRAVVEIYGTDGSPDTGYLKILTDAASGLPGIALAPDYIGLDHDGAHGVALMYNGVTGIVQIDGNTVLGPRGAHIANPTGGGTTDAEARTAINSILTALETHGLLASS